MHRSVKNRYYLVIEAGYYLSKVTKIEWERGYVMLLTRLIYVRQLVTDGELLLRNKLINTWLMMFINKVKHDQVSTYLLFISVINIQNHVVR